MKSDSKKRGGRLWPTYLTVNVVSFMAFGYLHATGANTLWHALLMYVSLAVVLVFGYIMLGLYFNKRIQFTRKKQWLVSITSAFLIAGCGVTIAEVFGGAVSDRELSASLISGIAGKNALYALIALPLTAPFAKFQMNSGIRFSSPEKECVPVN